MSHERGEITKHNDCIFKDGEYYKVYTGCKHLDDFYTCEEYETALRIQREMLE